MDLCRVLIAYDIGLTQNDPKDPICTNKTKLEREIVSWLVEASLPGLPRAEPPEFEARSGHSVFTLYCTTSLHYSVY